MIEIKDLNITFDFPEKVSVKDTLRFHAFWAQTNGDDMVFVKRWEFVNELGLIKDWKCEYYPDPKQPLEEVEDPRIATAVIEALMHVYTFVTGRRNTEKK